MLPILLAINHPDPTPYPFAFVTNEGNIAIANSQNQITEFQKGQQPDLSPDGKTLIFWAPNPKKSPNEEPAILITLNTQTKKQTIINRGELRAPSFSPDGQKIAFTKHSPEGWQLWIAPTKTPNQPQRISSTDGFNPAWYPDSNALLWPSLLKVTKLNINQTPAWERLKSSYINQQTTPTWKDIYTPNPANPETMLINTYIPSDSRSAENGLLAILAIYSPNTPIKTITPSNLSVSSATWSKDGKRIIFSAKSTPEKPNEIYSISPTGNDLIKLFPGHSPSP